MTSLGWLALAGVLVIAGLAIYAGTLWRQVWRQERQKKAAESARNERLAGDVQILAQGMLSGQVPVIEGAIRIKVLLDNYSGPRRADLDIEVFEHIYKSTAHIPTHEAWQDLSAAERDFHRRMMDTLERDQIRAVEQAARQLCDGLE